jgi:fatty-acyl-CoA synthase
LSRPLVFTDAIAARAWHTPDRPALVDATGTLTYGALWADASRTAAALRRHGVGRGDLVAVAMEPSAAQAAALLGVMEAGAVACPLNVRLAPPEVAAFLGPLGPRLAIAAERHAPLVAGLPAASVIVAGEGVAGALEAAAGPFVGAGPVAAREDDPLLVVGTGGTTGVPKAATYSQRGVWAWCATCGHIQEMREDDQHLYLSPFFHSTIVTNLLTALFVGAAVRVLPSVDHDAVARGIAAGEVTWLYAAPTVLTRLLDAPGLRPGRLRVVAFGSMRSQAGMPGRLREAFPGVRLLTGYGTTEFGPVTRLKGEEIGTDPGCVGRPVPGARIEIRRADGSAAPVGEEGEIVVWCPWQMDGYWGRPEQTAATMVDGGIRPGDIGALDADGSLHLRGRSKEAIVTGGENVWPAEVENALLAHPEVADAVVYGVDDAVWGERVEAAVVLTAGSRLGLDDLRAFGRAHVASYKLPRSLRVVDAIPLTPLSKPDRLALRRAAAADPLRDMVGGAPA